MSEVKEGVYVTFCNKCVKIPLDIYDGTELVGHICKGCEKIQWR